MMRRSNPTFGVRESDVMGIDVMKQSGQEPVPGLWFKKVGLSASLCGLGLALAACGGGSASVATTKDGRVIKTSEGAEVSEVAHNHWLEAKKTFEAYEAQGWNEARCDESAAKFEKASDAHRGFAEAIYMTGLAHHRCDREDKAYSFYEKALQANDKFCKARVLLGQRMLDKGAEAGALAEFVRSVRDDPQCTEGYVNVAVVQRKRGGAENMKEALNNLRRAMAIDAMYLPAFNEMALLFLEQAQNNKKMLDLAEVVCSQAQKIDDGYAPIYNTWGLIDLRRKNIINAAAKFKRAIELDSKMFEAYMNFGQLTLSFRGYDDARQAFERAVELQPKSFPAHLGLGVAFRGLEQNDKAQTHYEKAREIAPDRAETYYNLGVLYQDFMGGALEDMEKAKTYYDQFLSRAKGDPQYASVTDEITRRCKVQAQGKRKAPRRVQCVNGRLQNIEEFRNALKAMEEMQELEAQMQKQQAEQEAAAKAQAEAEAAAAPAEEASAPSEDGEAE
jgi:tetratricopeptide (TPR) repeat protein